MVQTNNTHKRVALKKASMNHLMPIVSSHSGRSSVHICDVGFSTSLAQYWG